MPIAGVIAERVKGLVPITWDALVNDSRVGETPLQLAIDTAKETVAGVIVAPNAEQNYPVVVVDYIAKLAVIDICTAAQDFWMNQTLSISTTGTNENASYVDRAAVLEQLRKDLIEETRMKQWEIAKLIGFSRDDGRDVPLMNTATINPFHLTPSPEEFPRPYRQTQYS